MRHPTPLPPIPGQEDNDPIRPTELVRAQDERVGRIEWHRKHTQPVSEEDVS